MLKFIIFNLFFFSANSFNSFTSLNSLNLLNNHHISMKKPYVKRFAEPLMIKEICPNYLEKYTNLLNENQSELLVKKITSFLTNVDGFGGYVLHTNDVLINIILNNDYLPMERKKSIILFLIQISQYGDSTGSHILQFYHDLVNCLL